MLRWLGGAAAARVGSSWVVGASVVDPARDTGEGAGDRVAYSRDSCSSVDGRRTTR